MFHRIRVDSQEFFAYLETVFKVNLLRPIVWLTQDLTLLFDMEVSAFQSESTLYSCLNVKKPLARNRRDIGSLSDYNGTRTHNHLVRERTLNHLAKWLSVCLQTEWLWVRVPLQSLKPMNCLSAFDHFVGLVLKWLKSFTNNMNKSEPMTGSTISRIA